MVLYTSRRATFRPARSSTGLLMNTSEFEQYLTQVQLQGKDIKDWYYACPHRHSCYICMQWRIIRKRIVAVPRCLSGVSAGIDLNAMAVLTVSPKLCLPQASSPAATTQFNKMMSDIKHLIKLCLYVYKL